MAGLAPNRAVFDAQLTADAKYLQSVYVWLKTKFSEYQTNAGAATLAAVPYSYTAAEQNQVGVLLGDLNNLIHAFEGQAPPTNSNIVNDVAVFVGIS